MHFGMLGPGKRSHYMLTCRSDEVVVPAGQVLVCSSARAEWPILHASAICHSLLASAAPESKLLNASLWDVFGHPGASSIWRAWLSQDHLPVAEAVYQRSSVSVNGIFAAGDAMRLIEMLTTGRKHHCSLLLPGGKLPAPAGQRFKLTFLNAAHGRPAQHGSSTGIPTTAFQVGCHRCPTITFLQSAYVHQAHYHQAWSPPWARRCAE